MLCDGRRRERGDADDCEYLERREATEGVGDFECAVWWPDTRRLWRVG